MENSKDILEKGNIDAEKSASLEAAARQEVLAENAKKRKARLIKLGAMLAMTVIVLVFVTIGWFSMNKETSANGGNVNVSTLPYVIEPLSGGNNIYQDYHDEVMSSDTMVWAMTSTDKMNNNNSSTDKGIKPGHYGQISFYVKPRDTSINLDLTFEIVGYSCTETTDEETDETTITMTPVDAEYQRYLAGHIFLFADRVDITDPETEEVIGYTYSKPIVSGADLKKTLPDQTYTKATQDTPVTIYWVWPETLSTLVDARINSNVNIEPFISGADRTAVVTNIATYPNYYFHSYTAVEGVTLTESTLATGYDTYGEKYDSADNAIGKNVNYIRLKMTTEESSEGE